tara:strand:+ start:238 stop:852 length:615 start_codon:yes stop_codon:yes gene_type:complete
MAVYNAIKYNHDYLGQGGNLFPLASSSISTGTASVSFTSGIDSTFDSYLFIWNSVHPSTNGESTFGFQVSTNGGSSYGITTTSTMIQNYNNESGSSSDNGTSYYTGGDQAQGTATQIFSSGGNGGENDETVSGMLRLFNPSSTTFVKHYIATTCNYQDSNYINHDRVQGYFNTTSAINAVRFLPGRVYASTNLDSGKIQMFGIK